MLGTPIFNEFHALCKIESKPVVYTGKQSKIVLKSYVKLAVINI